MILDREDIDWVQRALGDMRHGSVEIVVCDKKIVKVISKEHKTVSKVVDKT